MPVGLGVKPELKTWPASHKMKHDGCQSQAVLYEELITHSSPRQLGSLKNLCPASGVLFRKAQNVYGPHPLPGRQKTGKDALAMERRDHRSRLGTAGHPACRALG